MLFPPFFNRKLGPSGPNSIEGLTIVSASTTHSGYNYLVVSGTPSLAAVGDRIEQGASECFIQAIIDSVIFVDTATGFSAGAADVYEDTGGTPLTIRDTVTVSSTDTTYTGYHHAITSANASNTAAGDLFVQGSQVKIVTACVDKVIFLDSVSSITATTAKTVDANLGTPLTINATPTISSVNTSITGYPYVIFSSAPASTNAQDLLVQGSSVTYLRAVASQVGFVNSSTGLTGAGCSIIEATVGSAMTQNDQVSLSAIDTNVTNFNYFTMASAMSNTNTGDLIVQGTQVGYVQDRLNTLIFPNSTSGFSAGSNLTSFEASVSGAGLSWQNMDLSQLGTLSLWYKASTGITSSGGVVSAWANQGTGGSTYNLTDGGASGRRPTLNSADSNFNGYDSMSTSYNGAAPVKRLFASDAPALTAATCFMVVKMVNDPAADGNTNEFWKVSSTANLYPIASGQGGTVNTVTLGTFTNSGKATAVDPSPALNTSHISSVDSETNNWKWYLNGNQEYSTATNTFSIQTGNGALSMGGTGSVGSDCRWAELGAYTAVLASARRWMMHKHLSVKFAITLKDLD